MPEKHGCPNHALNLITFIHKEQTRPDRSYNERLFRSVGTPAQKLQWFELSAMARMVCTPSIHQHNYTPQPR